jgi:hypothetical protein
MRSVPVPVAAAIDVVCVLAFVVIGRANHAEGLTPAGIVDTGWPFVAGLAIGWVVATAWRAPARVVPHGAGIWAITVAAALVLRDVAGEDTPLSFAIVTTLFLAATLLGWRGVTALALRRRTPAA